MILFPSLSGVYIEENVVKFISRIAWLPVILLLIGLAIGPARAQSPNPKYDAIFAPAQTLEAARPSDAYNAYVRIKNEHSKEPDLAADALLRAAEFASSQRYGTTDAMHAEGNQKAHDALKQLLQQYPQTAAAKVAEPLQENIERRIDQHNSQYFSYKLIDSLVALTGRVPGFSYWFALLLIAVFVKLITLPLTLRMYKSQREMQKLQPILKQVQEKYKGKPELGQKTMEVYKEHGISPFASCLPMLVQFPFLIWVYNTIRLYEFHFVNGTFLWIGSPLSSQMAHHFPGTIAANLGQFDMVLLVLYAASNYVTMKLTPSPDPQQAAQQKQMSVMMTIMMFWMFMIYRWSAAFMLYWLALNLLTAWQQYTYIYKPSKLAGPGGGGGGLIVPSTTVESDAEKASSNGSDGRAPRELTPVPGGNTMRPRPRRKRR